MNEPLHPRITKSTAIAIIHALLPTPALLLKRFEVAKAEASVWDGERDGLREAVKLLPGGQYDDVILSWAESAAVTYVNADGKYQVKFTLQSTIPAAEVVAGANVVAFQTEQPMTPEQLLNQILHLMTKGKDAALAYLKEIHVGNGTVVDNGALYEDKGSARSKIVVLPTV